MGADAWNHSIIYEFHRVGGAGVLGEVNISVVWLTRFWIQHYILKDGTEPDGVVNLRFFLLAQVDALCITPAFEVENPSGAPTVLVVADEAAGGIGGEGGFSCPPHTDLKS